MTDKSEKDIDYYLNLDWTIVFGTDTDFNGKLYHYIEIKEFPSFVYCAPSKEIALENYKTQLKLTLQVMLEYGEEIPQPGDGDDDTDWESLCP